MGVAASCELGAAQLGQPLGLPDRLRTQFQAWLRCRAAAPRGSCRERSGRRRCSRQPPRSVRSCSTATQSRTGTPAAGWSTARAGSISSSAQAIGSKVWTHSAEQPRIGGDGGGDIQIAPGRRAGECGCAGWGAFRQRTPIVRPPGCAGARQGPDVGLAYSEVAWVEPISDAPRRERQVAPRRTSVIVSNIGNQVRPEDRSTTR